MKKSIIPLFICMFCNSIFANGIEKTDLEMIKKHISETSKIEIIFDLSKGSQKGWDKNKKIWIIPNSHKTIITEAEEVAEIKKLITYEPDPSPVSEGVKLMYFWVGDRVLYTTFINNVFMVHLEDPKKPGFLDRKYKFKMSKDLIKKIYSYETKK